MSWIVTPKEAAGFFSICLHSEQRIPFRSLRHFPIGPLPFLACFAFRWNIPNTPLWDWYICIYDWGGFRGGYIILYRCIISIFHGVSGQLLGNDLRKVTGKCHTCCLSSASRRKPPNHPSLSKMRRYSPSYAAQQPGIL